MCNNSHSEIRKASFATDAHGRIVAWSRSSARLFGRDADSVRGKRCWGIVHGRDVFGNDLCTVFCAPRGMLCSGRSVNPFNITVDDGEGRQREFRVSMRCVSLKNGEPAILHLLEGMGSRPTPVRHRDDTSR